MPGPSIIERLVAAALCVGGTARARDSTHRLPGLRRNPAEAPWRRCWLPNRTRRRACWPGLPCLPAGTPGHTALKRLTDQLAWSVRHRPRPDKRRRHSRRAAAQAGARGEGGRFTAQHLRLLSPLRRRATLVATVLDTIVRLTDDGIALFDRAVGRMFRRAEARREEVALLRDARAGQ